MCAEVARCVAIISVPLFVDMEGGYGAAPEDVAETVLQAIRVGAVGANIEDSIVADETPMLGKKKLRLSAYVPDERQRTMQIFPSSSTLAPMCISIIEARQQRQCSTWQYRVPMPITRPSRAVFSYLSSLMLS